ncbi:unnamed protein product [Hermetia illucens]|uniref:Uncharacterized protein n=2 Tax=Hermetia illucens TaxID=343691 RepID=A0A7R8YQN9_HERIL|nr:unnamed protein product [Hermetia illucens]
MSLVFVLLLFVVCSQSVTASTTDANSNGKPPYETQRAQCTVTAGEVQASAEASVSKTLEGVCGSDEMKLAFASLELKLTQELETIKELIRSMQGSKILPTGDRDIPQQRSQGSEPHVLLVSSSTPRQINTLHTAYPEKTKVGIKPEITSKSDKASKNLKFLPTNQSLKTWKSSRDAEVDKLNNTMLSGVETKLFAYYWKLDKFTQKLKSNVSIDHSPMFAILGKRLRLKAVFNHLNRDFLYLLVENASNVRDEFQSVFLETGNMFKPLQTKFKFKHKIAVLEQTTTSNLDLESQEFTSIESGFLIPNSALLTNSYLKNDTILVKLIVYL